jgi:hypothetical protein
LQIEDISVNPRMVFVCQLNKKVMEIHEFVALRRSGHHAILNWIIRNMIGQQSEFKYKITHLAGTFLHHINEGNFDTKFSIDYINQNYDKIRNLLVSYEDSDVNFCLFSKDFIFRGPLAPNKFPEYKLQLNQRFIIIRDFYNNLSSRIKGNQDSINKGLIPVFDVREDFINKWKDYAKNIVSNKLPHLKFEDWLDNPDKRNQFLKENFNIHDRYGIDNIVGTYSSFGESKNYKKRFDPDLIPEEIKEIVRKDGELHYLIGRLGYDFRKI